MGDNVGTVGKGADTVAQAGTGAGGLIDVSGMRFDELADALGKDDLGRALDYILASGQNGGGYHGFTNKI